MFEQKKVAVETKQKTQLGVSTKTHVGEKLAVLVIMTASLGLLAGFAFGMLQTSGFRTISNKSIITIRPPVISVEFSKYTANAVKYDVVESNIGALHHLEEPSFPRVPYQAVNFLVPFGEKIENISVQVGNPETIENIKLAHAQEPKPMLATDQEFSEAILSEFGSIANVPKYLLNKAGEIDASIFLPTAPDADTYASNEPYPGEYYRRFPSQYKKGYEIVTFHIYNYQYQPASETLLYYPDISLTVTTKSDRTKIANPLLKDSAFVKNEISNIVTNSGTISTYKKSDISRISASTNLLVNKALAQATSTKPSNSPELTYEYIIITDDQFVDAFQPLLDHKLTRSDDPLESGIIISTSFINSNYSHDIYDGNNFGVDELSPSKMRNFIIDAYQYWAPETGDMFILLGGDYEYVPIRKLDGNVNVMYDYHIPADIYFAGLDGTWDMNGDGAYGNTLEDADLLTEVIIGRAPVGTDSETTNFVNKTITYENLDESEYEGKALFIGRHLSNNYHGGNQKDHITEQGAIDYYSLIRRYNQNDNYYWPSMGDLVNLEDISIINDSGHGTSNGFGASQPEELVNTEPMLVVSTACLTAMLDCDDPSAQYPCIAYEDSIGERYVTGEHGAFAFIGNTRVGWIGIGGKYDESLFNQLHSYEAEPHIGRALQKAKEALYDQTHIGAFRWLYYSFNLFGDPETRIKRDLLQPRVNIKRIPDMDGDPYNYDFPIRGDVEIYGTAQAGTAPGATFDHYELWYGYGVNPTEFYNEPFHYDGLSQNQEVDDDLLGYFDITQLSESGQVTVIIKVFDTTGRMSFHEMVFNNVIIDGPVLNLSSDYLLFGEVPLGQTLERSLILNNEGTEDLIIQDIQISSHPDYTIVSAPNIVSPFSSSEIIIAYTSSELTYLEAYLEIQTNDLIYPDVTIVLTGSILDFYAAGWPRQMDANVLNIIPGDLNGDGVQELVVAMSDGTITVLDNSGEKFNSFLDKNVTSTGMVNGTIDMVVADINGDGTDEIVYSDIQAEEATIFILDQFGNSINSAWPKQVGVPLLRKLRLSVADIDGNGLKEIIGSFTSRIEGVSYGQQDTFIWEMNGNELNESWHRQYWQNLNYVDPLAVGDINFDGVSEIITSSNLSSRFEELLYLDEFAQIIVQIPSISYPRAIAPIIIPIKDSFEKLIVSRHSTKIYLYDSVGLLLDQIGAGSGAAPIFASDLNHDGNIEIITGGGIEIEVNTIIDNKLENYLDWPYPIDTYGSYRSLVVGNIDNSPELEVIVLSRDMLIIRNHDNTSAGYINYLNSFGSVIFITDLDGDQENNLIFTGNDGTIHVMKGVPRQGSTFEWRQKYFDSGHTNFLQGRCIDDTYYGDCNDSGQMCYFGELQASCPTCGDVTGDGVVDISDLVYLIDYMFLDGPPPSVETDIDGTPGLDISDLVRLIDYMFLDGPPPICDGGQSPLLSSGDTGDYNTLEEFIQDHLEIGGVM